MCALSEVVFLHFMSAPIVYNLNHSMLPQGRSQEGRVILVMKNPPNKERCTKGPLECMKRSTRMNKNVHYYSLLDQRHCVIHYTDIDLDTVEDLTSICCQILSRISYSGVGERGGGGATAPPHFLDMFAPY